MLPALFIRHFEDGGVERKLTNLARGLVLLGQPCDLVVSNARHAYVQGLPAAVTLTPVGDGEAALDAYLLARRPDLVITGKLADDRDLLAARERLGLGVRLVTTVGTPLSASLRARRFRPLRVWRETRRVRRDYAKLDAVTAVCGEVAADLRRHFLTGEVPLRVLPNPTLPDDFELRAASPCPHPWLQPGAGPVLIAVGGLRKVKDFATLLRAFALLPPATGARLIVLGEGKERAPLTALIRRLGISDRVDLHGFVPDPFPYLARASALVLSSRREGLPNVVVEAMALGKPVAATDCPGGVRDLLQDGALGPLTPVGDAAALSGSMATLLAAPADSARLRAAAVPYRMREAAAAYLELFAALAAGDGRVA
ncbi:glycosyltransferase [Thiohalocapsa sp. ML1]|uniref:glycosyltransferase n=1 Tax=Thiohalocapsa sp. ML1 TaxID=1431688 RepID=UPI0007323983|nr:glycosyltransferase [Thiohalocapsa sp. ML1]